MISVPEMRIRDANYAVVNRSGDYVLYWILAARRVTWNYALQRAAAWATQLRKPLLVVEEMRCGRRWECDRFHQFVLEGMIDTADRLAAHEVSYYPYVEEKPGEMTNLLVTLSRRACLIVTDHFPANDLPQMVHEVANGSAVLIEVVDANGLLPVGATDRVFTAARFFRRFLRTALPEQLKLPPKADPLRRLKLPPLEKLPREIERRWPKVDPRQMESIYASPHLSPALRQRDLRPRPPTDQALAGRFAGLRMSHMVGPVVAPGGAVAAEATLRRFIAEKLPRYAADRNHPDLEATSGLSPYLHFGHLSAHQVVSEVLAHSGRSLADLQAPAAAAAEADNWWGLDDSASAFLDQLITWRELGFNMAEHRADHDRYESLPDWARRTLEKHAADPREFLYSSRQFERAETHDPLWNAAQRQLVTEGRLHNYLRMLWGKKILEWTPDPRTALAIMIDLNNKYALDARDPNSYSGIFWVLGRYDRAWGPERPIFGTVRYMSSESTRRKLRLKNYLVRFGP